LGIFFGGLVGGFSYAAVAYPSGNFGVASFGNAAVSGLAGGYTSAAASALDSYLQSCIHTAQGCDM